MTDIRSHALPHDAVVVGVDGTESSVHAADWAAEHAHLEGLPLVVLHAVDDSAVEATAWAGVTWVLPTPLDRLLTTARQLVQETTDHVAHRHPDLAVHPLAVHGEVRRILVEVSREASMLVLGSRGRGPVGSAVLGSVGAHVTRHSHCPVVVCRPGHPGRVHDGVVVLCDGTPTSVPVVARAIEMAGQRGLPVTVLRCVHDDHAAGSALSSLEDDLVPLRARFPGVPVRAEIRAGEPDHALAARPRPADLVVVGRHPLDSIGRHLGHVNATRVIEHVESPVLVVPQAG
jgi:nucleotide-binding universal stress UspA family protein